MKKKTQQKVSQKAVKANEDVAQSQIPPYPKWVKYLFWVWMATVGLMLLLDISGIYSVTETLALSVVFTWLFLTLIVGGYGIYRAFRYFTKRAILVSGILFGLWVLLLLGIWGNDSNPVFITIREWCIVTLQASRSLIFGLLLGVITIHSLVAIFLKSARKMGWFIFYFGLGTAIAIAGQVFDYVTRKDVALPAIMIYEDY